MENNVDREIRQLACQHANDRIRGTEIRRIAWHKINVNVNVPAIQDIREIIQLELDWKTNNN